MPASLATIDRDRLFALTDRERAAYRASFPASREAFATAGSHLLGELVESNVLTASDT
jgi:hypothetical protein